MNSDERKTIARNLAMMFEIYNGNPISQESLSAMVDQLNDLPCVKIMEAINKILKDPKQNKFPLPAQIRQFVSPVATDDDMAKEAAARIIKAVSKFGWNNPGPAKEFIGDLGWGVVDRFGGWLYICQNLGTELDMNSFYAQARDLCKSHQGLAKSGMLDQPIGIEQKFDTGIDKLAADLAEKKLLPGQKN